MLKEFGSSLRLVAGTITVCVVGYALLILVIASVAAPEKRMGSLIQDESGQVIGSRMVAQAFTRPEYLWPRPSAVDYNAAGAGGSNLSPTSPAVRERAEEILAKYAPQEEQRVPTELVLASGAGLDPHISLEAAMFQARRVAEARGMNENEIRDLVTLEAQAPAGELFTDHPLINVLEFNVLLDQNFPLSPTE